jgi:DNA phosphorothioation-associated putative methyltransferase
LLRLRCRHKSKICEHKSCDSCLVYFPETLEIERHKAAIVRNDLSKPVRLALEAGLFRQNTTFFDYGCGHGGDVHRIAHHGYVCSGWDPYYHPETLHTPADVVNLGYVINVIESQAERREALIKAWELSHQVLIVAAQVLVAQGNNHIA